jgi:phage tail-like protein
MAPTQRRDPYQRANFIVIIDGEQLGAAFVTPPGGQASIVYYRDGADPTVARPMRGKVTNDVVTLRRGYNGDATLYEWWQQVRNGSTSARRMVSIILLDDERNEVTRWLLNGAYPSSHRFEALDADSSEPVVEVVELVYSDYRIDL